jgi:molybdopterin converting factor small subunit
MKVRVEFVGALSERFGTKTVELDLENRVSIVKLFCLLSRNAEWRVGLLDQADKPRNYLLVFKNGQIIFYSDWASTKLEEGDEIVIALPVAGG